MPLYEYRCENGHNFEALQRMSDDPVAECERCGAPVQRVFHPVAVHFKGSGFYTTDYGRKKSAGASSDDGGGGSGSSSSDGKDGGSKEKSAPAKSSSSSDQSGTAKSASSD